MALAAVVVAAGGGLGAVSRSFVTSATRVNTQRGPDSSSVNYLRPRVILTTLQGSYFLPDTVGRASDSSDTATPEPTPTPEPSPTPEATPTPTPAPPPAFFTYAVQAGDTVAGIAARFGIDAEYILVNNPEVRDDPDLLAVGQQVVIPSVNGLIYTVKLGDTLSDIAAFYGIDVESIVGFVPNGLSSADDIIEGLVLVLPGAVPPPPPPPAPAPIIVASEEVTPPATFTEPASASGFIWPFVGAISQYYGGYHHGIDIDAFGNYGAAVVAAAGGQVVLVSWQEYGLGYHVIIRHDDGNETVYAHLSDIYVGQGQFVGQGETIGAIGCTGYCTGPHLHFEVRVGGYSTDPLGYLP